MPAAQDPPPAPSRKRPLIYVYDMPPEFTTRILQYRITRNHCVWRATDVANVSWVSPQVRVTTAN